MNPYLGILIYHETVKFRKLKYFPPPVFLKSLVRNSLELPNFGMVTELINECIKALLSSSAYQN